MNSVGKDKAMIPVALNQTCYLLALGGNMPHPRLGLPHHVLCSAFDRLSSDTLTCIARSPIVPSKAVGPSLRNYANAAALVKTTLLPGELLAFCKQLEQEFGGRSKGQRWSARRLDLDIVLWSGGRWNAPGLVIPHPLFRTRDFVLRPSAAIAGAWRDPVTGLTVRQLLSRLCKQAG
ncbi:2-amino-4-hydroxy-6-hydroxymethyldihydropteridine diphosphokinase [Croceicoccus sp. F390]|uniref:2-amino-4-hydroxy-6-hydroxymethyldihydropteridine pyrophosphokinase n=1 Tax=Croceicoccus esteveae TaxID=3075597 RepID=A0ABU2ZIT5_9SPHN|nr:2-amino-4-hydroxy-6-hydroxymethyldihydropteridine diphosphokinase [Croceicoccus sp. F390]MDT0576504.1 2-amino-4-hydroxy-6-hydroxymethyldihydropteridine diphosphokinase [Croceicoccus sp. F390]